MIYRYKMHIMQLFTYNTYNFSYRSAFCLNLDFNACNEPKHKRMFKKNLHSLTHGAEPFLRSC
jgi:hypothetical protein